MRDIQHLRDLNQRIANAEADANNADWLSLKASLVQRGYAPKVVERVVSQASCTVAVGDMFGMVQEVTSLLAAEAAPRPEKVRRPALDRKRKDKHPDEMCTIASMSEDPVAALAEVGIVATPQQILAA